MAFDYEQDAYQSLRGIVGERTRDLLVWVGSGPSTEAQLPTWSALRNALTAALEQKAHGFESPDSEKFYGYVRLIQKEPRSWLAFQLLREKLGFTTYAET